MTSNQEKKFTKFITVQNTTLVTGKTIHSVEEMKDHRVVLRFHKW